MEEADLGGDVHLVGGQRTLETFLSIGALAELGVLTVPRFVGSGVRMTVEGSAFRRARRGRSGRCARCRWGR